MKVAEIETTDERDDGWRDWIVVRVKGDYVSISHDYQSPGSDERKTWQDEGSGCGAKHLDALIAALQEARAMVSRRTETKEKHGT